ncbi:MAG: YggS family pyridoxal phosphate-dependent enzyme [Flavobacteriales bacterium]
MSDHTATLAERYAVVRAGIPAHVQLVAVSKTRTVQEVQALYDLGHRAFGENYPQELRDKQPLLPADIQWHFIGHLQRNKVKYIAPFVHLIHSVDGTELLDEIQKRATAAGRHIGVLVQVHIAQEETKHGLDVQEARALITDWDAQRWSALALRGLMGMASNTEDVDQVREEFTGLAALFNDLKQSARSGHPEFDTLSMGMSGDADLAIAAGSTLVRIGTSIFGQRG